MKMKQIVKLALLFAFLIFVAFFPIYLSSMQNRTLINHPVFAKMENEEIGNQEVNDEVHAFERLWIIIMANSKDNGIITERNDLQSENNHSKEVISRMEKEIISLQNQGMFPNFSFSSEYKLWKFNKITFMDYNTPSVLVSVWDITIGYDDFYVKCWLDSETNKIYQIEILSEEKHLELENFKFNPISFLDYLNIPRAQIIEHTERSKERGEYHFDIDRNKFSISYQLDPNVIYYNLNFSGKDAILMQ
ncbi:MAG: hypothetical protein RR626_07615 [Anaerovoracaceae bacterium]